MDINGAVNTDTLEAKHPDAKVIHVIVDNATYDKSKWVKEYWETSRMKRHVLPGDFLKKQPLDKSHQVY